MLKVKNCWLSKNPKTLWKSMKISQYWQRISSSWGNSMKFSGKMCLKTILKVTKNQSFTFSLEVTFFEKPQRRGSFFFLSIWPVFLHIIPYFFAHKTKFLYLLLTNMINYQALIYNFLKQRLNLMALLLKNHSLVSVFHSSQVQDTDFVRYNIKI